ncbi:ACP S-malonyltransferase [candidate division KSB1 bacterium]|nr:ACP S-malonyltransferase [candidate division KSB1 bacterium]RQW07320.1 MAG: [acyl-carrier-protein] S-malonyltransferase [candidate division KSB1 bacterium]
MKCAFIFPGQGSQFMGMAQDFYHKFASVRERYGQASELLGFDLARLSFEGPEAELAQTDKTQPALFVHSFVINEILKERGILPSMVAGHSLGEYSSLAAADVFEFSQALKLVKLRGQLMQNAGERVKGAMAAIIGLDYLAVHNICQRASRRALVDLANFNSPDQIVISGTVNGVELAMSLAQKAGAKRAVRLNVSGAFHSPLMQPVLNEFLVELDKVEFDRPSVPVFSNVTGQATENPAEIKMFLGKQLLSPVLWTETIRHMVQGGARCFLEVGPGKTLTFLLRRIDRQIDATAVGTVEELEKLSERLL